MKKKNEIKLIHLSYSVIVAVVCHVTIMTRRNGNSKGKRSKIMVALKKLTLGVPLEYFKLTTERDSACLKHRFYV